MVVQDVALPVVLTAVRAAVAVQDVVVRAQVGVVLRVEPPVRVVAAVVLAVVSVVLEGALAVVLLVLASVVDVHQVAALSVVAGAHLVVQVVHLHVLDVMGVQDVVGVELPALVHVKGAVSLLALVAVGAAMDVNQPAKVPVVHHALVALVVVDAEPHVQAA